MKNIYIQKIKFHWKTNAYDFIVINWFGYFDFYVVNICFINYCSLN